jgi:hypothetical protein
MRLSAAGKKQPAYRAGKRRQGSAIHFIAGSRTFWREPHKSRIDQHLQMLRHCRLREIQPLNDVLAAAGLRPGQMQKNFDPRWVRQRSELRRYGCAIAAGRDGRGWGKVNIHRSSAIYDEHDP